MSLYFECSVRYDKMQQNGSVKKVTEKYIVDALTFTEAEARIIEAITPYISGEYSIPAIKKTKIAEVFTTSQALLAIGKNKSVVEKAVQTKDAELLEKATSIDSILKDVDSRWFLVKVAFITFDEKTSAEKRSISQILVESTDIAAARERFNDGMKGTMANYDIESIADTKYMDVFTFSDFAKHDD